MKTKEYLTENFETEFEKVETITSLRELLKRMKMQRVKWIADKGPRSSPYPFPLLNEQMSMVQWELERLLDAQRRGRFRDYYAFKKNLDEHYPCKTPLLNYKYILDDGVSKFRKEILANMLHLDTDERKPYLVQMQKDMEELLENVYAKEETVQEWCAKYNTSEKEIFAPSAQGHRNRIYDVVKAPNAANRLRQGAMAVDQVLAGVDETNDAFEIQNDFYNVFYGRAIENVLTLVKEQLEECRMAVHPGESVLRRTAVAALMKQEVRGTKAVVKEFEELFLVKEDSEACFQLLKDAQPQVVDDSNKFCLGQRSKGAIVAWVDAMKDKNKMWKCISDSILASVLNNKINGLNITDRTLRSAQTKESKDYKRYYKLF